MCDRVLYTLDEGHFSGFSLHCRSTFRDGYHMVSTQQRAMRVGLPVLFRQCGNSFVVELDEHTSERFTLASLAVQTQL